MNKEKFILVALVILSYMGIWQVVSGRTESTHQISIADTSDVNPNGSSELSMLMRDMFEHAALAKKMLAENKKIDVYPENFDKIYTAAPTDDETKNSFYDTFADIYLKALKGYVNSSNADLKEDYNNLVNTCLACHSTHCPGPVPRIKKLLVK
ncbi:MAG: hypothetical protein DWQ44_01780 [Bacteroidetes bacterium]|nr:MAG: hypothetical protein DWQ33_05510 [Bacteroidota bacterium]REK04710.1 MAG: hypothetical protein DWQ39_05675 [Bacteroidota bacterium]REK36184.1 MAG: hypothetical protein DWQ44_01780 [Bacteroidota bacterium]REK51445.1 MAG: hypothetical protein DWQ48_01055 [Bacteroidota bacterium]